MIRVDKARWSALLAAAGLLAACAEYALVEPGVREVGGAYRVHPQVAWNRRADQGVEFWTIDGEALQQLSLYAGIEDGDALLPGKTGKDEDMPVYRSGMRAVDVQDLVVASYRETGAQDIEARGLRPAPFGPWRGFRFELDFVDSDGLQRRAKALGAIDDDGRLHLILYDGSRQHYFPKYEDEVDSLMGSVEAI